jgi:acetyltransferase-like isoleucine patch superfamily enzyme
MRSFVRRIGASLRRRRWQRKFPRSVIHVGATLCEQSSMGDCAVLFEGASLLASSLGAYSYVQSESVVNACDVGPFGAIGPRVALGLAAHPTHCVSTSPVFYDPRQPLPTFLVLEPLFTVVTPRTHVGADVWIGHGALIKAGLHIGVGSVVGAGAVVTRDVAPFSIVGGNPARVIRMRFAPELIEALLVSRWWERSIHELRAHADYFMDPAEFVTRLGPA